MLMYAQQVEIDFTMHVETEIMHGLYCDENVHPCPCLRRTRSQSGINHLIFHHFVNLSAGTCLLYFLSARTSI